MRRRADGWLNATQILKVAGVEKGKRTKVLEKEVLAGEHEKVQGGYGKYQGTWISYARGREFCRQYGVEDVLLPLLEYDMPPDGHASDTHVRPKDTPTKEQAMALNRKRLYNTSAADSRARASGQGTFFSNISPMTSVALDAMNKAAMPTTSNQYGLHMTGQQPGMASLAADRAYYSGDPNFVQDNGHEPPRKRMRPSENLNMSRMSLPVDSSMQSLTPTEINGDSFSYQADSEMPADSETPTMLPPLPTSESDIAYQKSLLLMDLFTDTSRSDYSDHPAMTQLNPNDYSMPLDNSANTALHWAATLARVPLLRLLLQKGANMWRGNAAGQSPLVSCVLVSNCFERSCFPEMLELLGPLIEVRDATGRTILHHIAVACGIKGRAPSSKYYLETLLEFLVRSAGVQSQSAEGQSGGVTRQPPSLMRFMSTIVNARDRAGNTALNLVARIGNRSIIQQLLEIKADPAIANHKGVSAYDFGIGSKDSDISKTSFMSNNSQGVAAAGPDDTPRQSTVTTASAIAKHDLEDQNSDVISCKFSSYLSSLSSLTHVALTTLLSQNLTRHRSLLASKNAEIDQLNNNIRELSAKQAADLERYQGLKRRNAQRSERLKRVENLRKIIDGSMNQQTNGFETASLGSADQVDFVSLISNPAFDPSHLPDVGALRHHLRVYANNGRVLSQRAQSLQSQSAALEAQYRRVVALCTGVEEDKVDSVLPSLVAAVESERGRDGLLGNKPDSNAATMNMSLGGDVTQVMSNQPQFMQQQIPQHHEPQQHNYQPSMPNNSFATSTGAVGALDNSIGTSIDIGRVRDFLAMVEGVHGPGSAGHSINNTAMGGIVV